MKELVKNFVKIGALASLVAFSNLVIPIVAGLFLVLKIVDAAFGISRASWRRRMGPAMAEADNETVARSRSMHRAKTRRRFFLHEYGEWNHEAFPADMVFAGHERRSVGLFTCCGLERAVRAEYLGRGLRGQKVRFSMELSGPRVARALEQHIVSNGIVGMRVERTTSGGFRLVSDNAEDMAAAVAEFFPPHTKKVEREIRTTRQYVVRASSPEAAESFVHGSDPSLEQCCVGEFSEVTDTVDGVRGPVQCNDLQRLNDMTLEFGQYLVNATDTKVYSRSVTFNARYDSTDDVLYPEASCRYVDRLDTSGAAAAAVRASAASSFHVESADLVGNRCSRESVVEAVPEENIRRYVNDGGRMLFLDGKGQQLTDGVTMQMMFHSLDGLLDVVSGATPLSGCLVNLDTIEPETGDGQYVLTVDADEGLLSCLSPVDGVVERIMGAYSGCGIDADTLRCSYICQRIEDEGYLTARLDSVPDLSQARVNGVPVSYLLERQQAVDDGRLPAFSDRKQEEQWLREASRIQDVSVELDMRRGEMVITSFVGNGSTVGTLDVRYRLSDAEMAELSHRGGPTPGELCDLLMASRPDVFAVYDGTHGPRREHVIGDYIGLERQPSSERGKTDHEEEKDNPKPVRKPRKGSGMKV